MRIHAVSEVTAYLKELLDIDDLLADIWISGEVSNLSESAAGHLYFTLKDESSQLRCVLFNRTRITQTIQNGMAAVAHGRISIYEVSGTLQLYVDTIQPEGTGILNLEFERLKEKLESEGLFEPARKREMPSFPRRIGVITSPDGAALRDITSIIGRRYPLAELLLCPTPVQGDAAAPGIVHAFETINRTENIDVVILARGGGSLEDLWAFNEEAVARAVYASRVPVITGIGHETDFTIADYVADLRAPTPSAAAEIAVPSCRELEARLDSYSKSLMNTMRDNLELYHQRVDELCKTAAIHINNAMATSLERFRIIGAELTALSPLSTLERGYALVERSDNHAVVTSIDQVDASDSIEIMLYNGSLDGRVTNKKEGLRHG